MFNTVNLSEVDIFKYVVDDGNKGTKLNLNMDEVIISDVKPYVDPQGKDSYQCTIDAKPGSQVYVGSVLYYFNKSDLDGWMNTSTGFPLDVSNANISNVSDALPLLKSTWGLSLLKTDIVDKPIDVNRGITKVTVALTDTCMFYKGNLTLSLYNQNYNLANVIPSNLKNINLMPQLPSGYVYGTSRSIPGYMIGNMFPWNNHKDFLKTIPVGKLSSTNLATLTDLLQKLTGLSFTSSDTSTSFNLYNATVLYNGIVSGFDGTATGKPNPKYNNCLVIGIDQALNSDNQLYGDIYLPYNN